MNYKILIKILVLVLICSAFLMVSGNNRDTTDDYKGTYVTLDGVSAEEFYNNGYTTNYVVGIDQFGRTFESTLGEKEDKSRDVGIFYFLTLGQHGATNIYDVTKILAEEDGMYKLFFSADEIPANTGCYWGEPIYGYYSMSDIWVIRRHLELLTAAGVDFIVFDVSNAVTYDSVVTKIANEVAKLKEEGFDCPELSFYTMSQTAKTMTYLYKHFYTNEKYDDVWYRIDGKPMLIGNWWEVSEEIQNALCIKEPQWPDQSYNEEGFPWMEWSYPQPVHNGVISVAVAAHPALPMSFSITRGANNWGRGYNVETGENESDKATSGQFFQSEWKTAFEEDPSIVFITGWNEWVAGKFLYDGEYAMVDLCNMEFSRDIEIVKGDYNDAFYIQMAKNIRIYKNNIIESGAQLDTDSVTVDIYGDTSVWDNVSAIYRTTNNANEARDHSGSASCIHYEQDAARNNIVEVRIASDDDNFYFYIKTSEDIVTREDGDTTWMNLFIGRGDVSEKGFESYEFVIGRSEKDGCLTVEKLKSNYKGKKVGLARYNVSGNVLQIEVPRKVLGIKKGVNNFYYKVADGIENPEDIMDYYVSGKSFPVGRLSYRYLG